MHLPSHWHYDVSNWGGGGEGGAVIALRDHWALTLREPLVYCVNSRGSSLNGLECNLCIPGWVHDEINPEGVSSAGKTGCWLHAGKSSLRARWQMNSLSWAKTRPGEPRGPCAEGYHPSSAPVAQTPAEVMNNTYRTERVRDLSNVHAGQICACSQVQLGAERSNYGLWRLNPRAYCYMYYETLCMYRLKWWCMTNRTTHICTNVPTQACMHAHTNTCIYIYIYTHAWVCALSLSHTRPRPRTYPLIHTHTHTRTGAYHHEHTWNLTCM